MEKNEDLMKNAKIPKLVENGSNLAMIHMSEENIVSFLEYLDCAILKSNILTNINRNDNETILAVLKDRTNDISVLSSICYGLLNSQKSLKKELSFLQAQVEKITENEQQMIKFQVFYENYVKNIPKNNQSSNLGGLKTKVDDLAHKNYQMLNEIMELTQTRESCEVYEKDLVDKILFQYAQKRQETCAMSAQLSDLIREFQKQQNEISELILENIDTKTKLVEQREKRRNLKRKLRQGIGKSVSTIDTPATNSQNPSDYINVSPSKENTSIFDHPSKNPDQISQTKEVESNYSDPDSYRTIQLGRDSSKTKPLVKISQNSKLMKQWRQLNSFEANEGLNSILKNDNNMFKRPNISQKNYNSIDSDTPRSIYSRRSLIFPISNALSENSGPPNKILTSKDQEVFNHPQLNHVKNIQNVNRTINKFGFIPPESPTAIRSLNSDSDTSSIQSSSLLDSIKNFFKNSG